MARRPGTLALWVAAATLAGCGEGPRSVLVPDTGWVAESELEAAIETWRGGRPAALTLAFDDNRATHLTIAAPELERRGLRGTFALNSGLVPSDGWEPWVALARRGHELANHGRTHRRLPGLPPSEARDEITRGRDEMQERLPPGQRVVTFVYPYADDDAPAREIARETHLSARTDGAATPRRPKTSPALPPRGPAICRDCSRSWRSRGRGPGGASTTSTRSRRARRRPPGSMTTSTRSSRGPSPCGWRRRGTSSATSSSATPAPCACAGRTRPW